jgi:hypothetical protein
MHWLCDFCCCIDKGEEYRYIKDNTRNPSQNVKKQSLPQENDTDVKIQNAVMKKDIDEGKS